MLGEDHLPAAIDIFLRIAVALGCPVLADHGFIQIVGLERLIPDDQTLALFLEMLCHAVVKIPLEPVYVFQAVIRHALLALRALFPLILGGLVAADVEIGRREQLRHLVQDVEDKLIGCLLARAGGTIPVRPVHVFGYKPAEEPVHLARDFAAAQPVVGRHRCCEMGGHVHFRHNHNVALIGVADDLTDFLLCIESAIGLALHVQRFPAVDLGILSFGPDLGQQRVLFDLNPPALVIRQVPVEYIDFVAEHQVQIALDGRHIPKVAGGI